MKIFLYWRNILEIFLLASAFYFIFLFLRGTRAFQVLKGMIFLLLVFIVSNQLELTVITRVMKEVFGVALIAIVVLFQPEIRRAFAALGRSHFGSNFQNGSQSVREILDTVSNLAERHIGALIVFVRENSLQSFIETGVKLDCLISMEILTSVFIPKTPLHDGAVVIDGNRIVAASCLLPLTQRSTIGRGLGTRHRAGIGITEETDAFVIIVSEETGGISVASSGKINLHIDLQTLERMLRSLYKTDTKKQSSMDKILKAWNQWRAPSGLKKKDKTSQKSA